MRAGQMPTSVPVQWSKGRKQRLGKNTAQSLFLDIVEEAMQIFTCRPKGTYTCP